MMFGHDGSEIGGPRHAQPFGTDPRVIGVDPITTGEGGTGPLQGIQRPRRDGAEKNGEAPLDHRELRFALAHVVQQRRLLQQLARLTFESHHRLEHVEAMALIIDRQLQEKGRELTQHSLGACPLPWRDASRCMPPELANPTHRGAGHSRPSVSGRPHRSFRRSSSKKLRPPLNWTSSTCNPGAAI